MTHVVQVSKDTKTVIFPTTIREVPDNAFYSTLLRAAILNEGLETLADSDAFSSTQIKSITLPSTLRTLGYKSFRSCSKLQRVTFQEGIKLW